MKHIFSSLLLLLSLTGLTACGDFLSEYSQDQIVAKRVQDLDEVLLGSGYLQSSVVAAGPSSGRPAGFFNVLDDDVNTGRDADLNSVNVSKAWTQSLGGLYGYFGWQQDVGTNYDATIVSDDAATWDALYDHINVVNVVLDEIKDLPHATAADEAAYYRVQGEAHFLRGQFYLTLVNLYADMYEPDKAAATLGVPLKLTPNVEFKFKRASVADVYAQIVADLTTARNYLRRSPQAGNHLLHRASAEAAGLLLSRVYLYMQQWDKAEALADSVMASTNFYLAPLSALGPTTVFLTAENNDVIFSQGSNVLSSTEAFTGRTGDWCVSRDLYDLYADADRRKTCFFAPNGTGQGTAADTDSIALRYKYERGNALRAHISDAFTLRMSEAWLNKAEACAMEGKEAEANSLLNGLRAARIDGYVDTTYTGTDLIDAVRTERRKELCFEGHRWFDLRRYAVCAQHPFTKTLVHAYHVCSDTQGVLYTYTLVLPPHDKSDTFAIPKSVMDYFTDGSFPTNPRDKRLPLEKTASDAGGSGTGEGAK